MERWSGDPDPSAVGYYISHYAGITLLGLVLGSVRWVWLYGVGNVGFYNAGSRRIHSMLLDRICGAPMSFFETTPGGRLMNLFGQDINRLDSQAADDFGRECESVLNEKPLTLIRAGTVMQGLVVVSAAIIITINSPVSAVFQCDDATNLARQVLILLFFGLGLPFFWVSGVYVRSIPRRVNSD
jgi:hypothetical protein